MSIHDGGYLIVRIDKPIGMRSSGTVYAWNIDDAVKKLSDSYDVVFVNEKLRFIDVLPKKGESK